MHLYSKISYSIFISLIVIGIAAFAPSNPTIGLAAFITSASIVYVAYEILSDPDYDCDESEDID